MPPISIARTVASAVAVASLAGAARAEGATPEERPAGAGVAERAVLLSGHLRDQLALERSPRAARVGIALVGGSGLVLGGVLLGAGTLDLDRAGDLLFLAGAGTAAGGAVATLFVSDSAVWPAAAGTAYATLGLLTLGQDLDRRRRPSVGGVAASAGFVGGAFLSWVNALGPPRPNRAELRADLTRVRSPSARATLAEEDVRAIEDDLRRARRPVPPAVVHAPLALGGAVGLVAAAVDERSRSAWPAALALAFGAAGMLRVEPFEAYSEALSRAGLAVAPAPGPGDRGGLSLVVAF